MAGSRCVCVCVCVCVFAFTVLYVKILLAHVVRVQVDKCIYIVIVIIEAVHFSVCMYYSGR